MSLPKVSTETTVQIAKMMREELAVEGAPARIVGRYGFSAMLPVAPCVERLAASVLKAEPSFLGVSGFPCLETKNLMNQCTKNLMKTQDTCAHRQFTFYSKIDTVNLTVL